MADSVGLGHAPRQGSERGWAIVLAAAALGLLSACQQGPGAPPDDGSLRVAVIGPMSGPYRAFGEQMRLGANEAVDQLNAAGGVLGKPLALEVLDDRCEPRRAARVAAQAVARGVVFVDGHFCSTSSIPAAGVYERAGVVQVTPASTSPALTDQGHGRVFRVSGRDDQQARFAADHVLDHGLGERVATVHDGSPYGEVLVAAFAGRWRERGGAVPASHRVVPGANAYPSLVTALAAAGTDLVYFGGYHPEAATIARDAAAAGLRLQLVGGDALVNEGFWKEAGAAGEGTLVSFAADPRLHPAAREAVARYRDRGVDPEGYVLYSQAAVQAWAEAAKRAGSTDGAAVAGALRAGIFPTVRGELAFDAKGDLSGAAPYVMYRWSGGSYAPVADRTAGTAALVRPRQVDRLAPP